MITQFTPDEKSQINQTLKDNRIQGKKQVFDLINQGGSQEQVYALINQMIEDQAAKQKPLLERNSSPVPYAVFGRHLIAQNAINDMDAIMSLPSILGGAIMPDGHRVSEDKTPVGSVVVAEQVFPSIVGADISCSVMVTVTGMEVDDDWFDQSLPSIQYVLKNKAYFGLEIQPDPVVFEKPFFKEQLNLETTFGQGVYEHVKKIARNHFATCGDGNHFLEFGFTDVHPSFMRGKKRYLSILSHFGSRGVGSTIAKAYEGLANERFEMAKGISEAPLDPNSPDGRDYIALMQWAGAFAEAGHYHVHDVMIEELHKRVTLDFNAMSQVYSRHNSMWITNDGYVHRKGATPAYFDQKGVIPATMGHATQIVVGLGNPDSFGSASHGGGRTHSRGQALQAFKDTHEYVKREYGVTLLGGDADENPQAYKDINDVMAAQTDCVSVIGHFYPKVVRMAEPRFKHWEKKGGK